MNRDEWHQSVALPRSLPYLANRLLPLVRQRLWLQVLIAMAAGVGFGILIGPTSGLIAPDIADVIGAWVALPGKLFLLAIQFVVVPLVVASVIRGIAAGQGTQGLGALGLKTSLFFVISTIVAVVIGIGSALLLRPGSFIERSVLDAALGPDGATAAPVASPAGAPGMSEIPNLITGLFPTDPLTTFTSGNMLQIVIAAMILGVAVVMTGADQRRPLLELLASVQAACMVIVGFVLRFAPLAVFGLLAQLSARIGLSALIGTGMYVIAVVAGLFVLFRAYLLAVRVLGGLSPIAFLRATRDVLLLAFSTSSSAAVMPATLTATEEKLGVDVSIARFVVPLGTTINMAGTALYQAVAALFLAQVFGVEIGIAGMVLIVVMATGAAIGSPGTPGVGIVILASILTSVGIPAAGIAIILGVDRLLDMCRTVVNVAGDMAASVVIDRWTGTT
ncbi:MAG: dicarboxylate/amino acid:cation symporter [Alphaproteobacteria bacterium]